MDSGLSSLYSSRGLPSSEVDHCLHELTRQMAYHSLPEQDDERPVSITCGCTFQGREKSADQTRRWVDLFSVSSPQSTPWSPSGLSHGGRIPYSAADKSSSETWSSEQDIGRDTPRAPKRVDEETWNKTIPVQNKVSTYQNPGNQDHELYLNSSRAIPTDTGRVRAVMQSPMWLVFDFLTQVFGLANLVLQSYFLPEKAPKQADTASRNPLANNNKQRTRRGLLHGECYISLSLPPPLHLQQKRRPPQTAGSGTRTVFPSSRTGSTGTGVFLPRTGGNPTEPPRRKPRCLKVLIPARVAQALTVHFSKTSPQSQPSIVQEGGGSNFFSQPGTGL